MPRLLLALQAFPVTPEVEKALGVTGEPDMIACQACFQRQWACQCACHPGGCRHVRRDNACFSSGYPNLARMREGPLHSMGPRTAAPVCCSPMLLRFLPCSILSCRRAFRTARPHTALHAAAAAALAAGLCGPPASRHAAGPAAQRHRSVWSRRGRCTGAGAAGAVGGGRWRRLCSGGGDAAVRVSRGGHARRGGLRCLLYQLA